MFPFSQVPLIIWYKASLGCLMFWYVLIALGLNQNQVANNIDGCRCSYYAEYYAYFCRYTLHIVDIYVGIIQYNHIVKAYMIEISLHYNGHNERTPRKIRVVDKRIGIIGPKCKEN